MKGMEMYSLITVVVRNRTIFKINLIMIPH
jgi:hypothetical protein